VRVVHIVYIAMAKSCVSMREITLVLQQHLIPYLPDGVNEVCILDQDGLESNFIAIKNIDSNAKINKLEDEREGYPPKMSVDNGNIVEWILQILLKQLV